MGLFSGIADFFDCVISVGSFMLTPGGGGGGSYDDDDDDRTTPDPPSTGRQQNTALKQLAGSTQLEEKKRIT